METDEAWLWPVRCPFQLHSRDWLANPTLKELGAQKEQLKEIADSCGISQGSYKPMTHEEILEIFHECYE